MNKAISTALNTRLSGLFSDVKVFSGYAKDQDLPYVQFNVSGITDDIELAGLPLAGNIFIAQVQIDFFYNTYENANDKLEDAKKSLLSDYPDLDKGSIISIYAIDFNVFENEELEQDGQRVYQGVLLFEIRIVHG